MKKLIVLSAVAILVTVPGFAQKKGGGGGGTASSQSAFAFAKLNLVSSSAAGVPGIEDPTAQGPVEDTGAPDKNNGDGICTYIELLDGGCKKSEDYGGPDTIIDGNGVCDTEATGKNFFGYDEAALGGALLPTRADTSRLLFGSTSRHRTTRTFG